MQSKTPLKCCRQKHDDVLEWIMFLNLHADMLYSIIWGDKDTYRLAFHLAGKSSGFSQVPGALTIYSVWKNNTSYMTIG